MIIIKYLFYGFCKVLVLIINLIFYPITKIRNRKYFYRKKATLAISNHPNTMFDPLVVAVRINRMVHFLANAGLYENPFARWLLTNTFGIKVERKQDVGEKKVENKAAFNQSETFLTNGGCLYSAVEGGSDIPRRLRKVKTGSARIALAAEAKNNFELGLEILPVGLNYSSQTKFRSKLFINVGEPIRVADFKENFRKDNFQAALDLTAEMDRRLRTILIDTVDDEEDAFLRKIETVSQTENKLPFDLVFDRNKKLLDRWRNFQKNKSTDAEDFKKEVNEYFSFLEKNKTQDHVLKKIKNKNFHLSWWLRTIFMVLSFPIFLYGWINNFLANYIPSLAFKKSGLHISYTSTVKILVGIFAYPIFYGIQIWIVNHLVSENWQIWVYIVSVVLAGVFAWWYFDFAKDTRSGWRLFNFSKKSKITFDQTFEDRKNIVKRINSLPQFQK